MKMNKEVKVRWVEALRSGEYSKGTFALRNGSEGNHRYCCLGVLCDLYILDGNKGQWEDNELTGNTSFVDSNGLFTSASLPDDVAEWSGVFSQDSSMPNFGNLDERVTFNNQDFLNLASINDAGVSFSVIADIIEENL